MSDHEIKEFCQEKFRQYDEHIKESPSFRDKVNTIDASLGWLVKAVDAYRNSDLTIKISLTGIVFAIIVQVGGFIYLWGRLTEKVDNLSYRVESMEKYDKTRNGSLSR